MIKKGHKAATGRCVTVIGELRVTNSDSRAQIVRRTVKRKPTSTARMVNPAETGGFGETGALDDLETREVPASDGADFIRLCRACGTCGGSGSRLFHSRSQVLNRLLTVAKEHETVIGSKQRVWNAGKSRAQATLDHDHGLGAIHVQNGHAR